MPRRPGTRPHTSDEAERELRALGAAILRERDQRGWMLEAMSEATGLDPAYLARVESGRIKPIVIMNHLEQVFAEFT